MNVLLSDRWLEGVAWSLVHSLWQGMALALVFALVVLVVPRGWARLRYGLGCAALLALPVLFVSTLVRELSRPQLGVVAERLAMLETRADTGITAEPRRLEERSRDWLEPLGNAVDALRVPLVSTWLVGVILFGLRLGVGLLGLRRWRKVGVENVPKFLEESLARLVDRVGVRRSIDLLQSTRCKVPLTLGWLRPVILLPASTLTGLNRDDLEAILLHELAHIRRHDYGVQLLQSVIETIFFYHPAAWWLSYRIRIEREFCCDDLAVRAGGLRCQDYARTLAALEGLRSAAPALGAGGGSLLARIQRLIEPGERVAGPAAPLFVAATLAAVVGGSQLVALAPAAQQSAVDSDTVPVVLEMRLIGLDQELLMELGLEDQGRRPNLRRLESRFYDQQVLTQELLQASDGGRALLLAAPTVAVRAGKPASVVTTSSDETAFEIAITPTLEADDSVRLTVDFGIRRAIGRDEATGVVDWQTQGTTGQVRLPIGVDSLVGRLGRFVGFDGVEQELVLVVKASTDPELALRPSEQDEEPEYFGEPISLSMTDVDIRDVLREIEDFTGLRFDVDPSVGAHPTTVALERVPWDQLLETILKINGLTFLVEGDVVRIRGGCDPCATVKLQR